MTRVKICGLTVPEDGTLVASAGADLIGLNLWPGSKRYVDLPRARAVADAVRAARPEVALVGVFVDPEPGDVDAAIRALDLRYVQLHGDESPERCAAIPVPVIKAIAMRGPDDRRRIEVYRACAAVLLDSASPGRGGSGRSFDWDWARAEPEWPPVILAGGLHADNVAAAIAATRPWAVDVASGVERGPGDKDPELVRRFLAAARGAA